MYQHVEKLMRIVRRYIPKRIYRYGDIGVKYFDDRTAAEKICDKIDGFLFEKRMTRIHRSAKRKQFFKKYFDHNWGTWISRPEDIRALEKKKDGQFVSLREWEQQKAKKDAERERVHTERIKNQLHSILSDVKKGRKFTRENLEHRKSLEKQYGFKYK